MTQENIEKARQQFVKASKEFNFTFISPYPLDEKINLFAFGFIDGYGSKSGAIITLEEPPQYEADKNVVEWCQKHDRWLSFIMVYHKAIRKSGWLFSVKSAVGGRNPPAVDEIASR